MNIFLWILQVLLAVHTAMGALWKFSNPAQAMPSLKAIPNAVWLGMSGLELLCVVGLLLPAIHAPLGRLAPIAALVIAGEMLLFTALHLASGDRSLGPVTYWLVVAAVSAFLAYGRFVLRPH